MAEEVKLLAVHSWHTHPWQPELNPRTHTKVEGENLLHNVFLCSLKTTANIHTQCVYKMCRESLKLSSKRPGIWDCMVRLYEAPYLILSIKKLLQKIKRIINNLIKKCKKNINNLIRKWTKETLCRYSIKGIHTYDKYTYAVMFNVTDH